RRAAGRSRIAPARTRLRARGGSGAQYRSAVAEPRRGLRAARPHAAGGAEPSFDFGGVVGEVAAARPTPLSVLRELVADNCGFATAVLEVQSKMLKNPLSR